ncbi:Transcriptional regulatory protein ZraR [Planctomycetes bacterium Poly30]|uniref:Transcriptional regulatory protein ZraR n=1 Tax=Saltatorellus ferox TaxID=2528018 RepID=A0A518EP73_9BACT|nr:Transcriptional regulatory protein ZraR [Planctomycetes bacterium Poly30]
MKPKLLFVEDDEIYRGVLTREIESFGYHVVGAASGEQAAELNASATPDLALVDLRLPGMGGLEVVETLIAAGQGVQAIVLTGNGGVSEAVAAMRLGAFDFLQKPIGLDVLEQTLARALKFRRLEAENQRLQTLMGFGAGMRGLLGSAPATAELRRTITRVAQTEATVLIQGENGTGKELVARTIHESGPRAGRPFVVVNCGAIPESLVESELFGHERGAFTGADRPSIGLFEAAHGGTLFLDEVGELPLAVQPVLLRAIQFGEIRPVGSNSTREVDCRVLAATNRDLEAEQARGTFREDLYYRLATLLVRVPPLRERIEDLPELLQTFLERSLPIDQRTPVRIEDAAILALQAHEWPGNVRELENAAVRLMTFSDGEVIRSQDVEKFVTRAMGRVEDVASGGLPTLDLEALERFAIIQALETCSGARAATAAALGISIKTLYNKIRRYGIETD